MIWPFNKRPFSRSLPEKSLHFDYEIRLVAFLDILGWRDLVNKSTSDREILGSISQGIGWIYSFQETMTRFRHTKKYLQATQFSDSIIISVSLDKQPDGTIPQYQLFIICCKLARLLMKRGIFLRGGITLGHMYHSGSIVFGPAVTEAYDLEGKSAVNPRIVTKSRPTGEPLVRQKRDEETGNLVNFWRQDNSEGIYFVDYLGSFWGSPKCDDVGDQPDRLSSRLEDLGEQIAKAIYIHKHNHRVLPNYLWLAGYYNDVAEEFGRKRILFEDIL